MYPIIRVLSVALVACGLSTASVAEGKDVEETYNKSCAASHAAATLGSRLETGMDAAIANVAKGLNAMPPKSMCMDYPEEGYAALIKHMSTAQQSVPTIHQPTRNRALHHEQVYIGR